MIKNKINLLFPLYLLILPLMCISRPFPLGNKIQYADILFAVIFLMWLFYTAVYRKTPLPPAGILITLALVIATNLFSCIFSRNISKSIPDFAGLVYLAALFIVAFSILIEKKMFEKCIRLIFIVSLVTSLFGLAIFIAFMFGRYPWTMKFLMYDETRASLIPFPRICSTLKLPEMFIAFSQLGLVSGMAILEFKKNAKQKIALILGITVIIIAACIAYSRSLTGFLFAFSMILLSKKHGRHLLPFKAAVALFTAFLLLMAAVTSVWLIYPVKVFKDPNANLLTVSVNTLPDIRVFLCAAAVNIAHKYPIFGIGQGVFTEEARHYVDLSRAKETIKMNGIGVLAYDPHCAYWGALAETGLFGLGAMLLFLFFLIKRTWLLTAKTSPFFWGFIGYLITGFFVDIFSLRQFWLLGALLLSASETVKQNDDFHVSH